MRLHRVVYRLQESIERSVWYWTTETFPSPQRLQLQHLSTRLRCGLQDGIDAEFEELGEVSTTIEKIWDLDPA